MAKRRHKDGPDSPEEIGAEAPQARRRVLNGDSPMSAFPINLAGSRKVLPRVPESENEDEDKIARLIHAFQKRNRQVRGRMLDAQLPFSWIRCLCNLLSLVLVCSDIPRSGLSVNNHLAALQALEPDVFQSYGPWFYSLKKMPKDTASDTTARVWNYKYDSTSIGLRAFGEFYQLPTFPDCILYRGSCPRSTLSGEVAFSMLDAVVNSTAMRPRDSLSEPVRVTLRTRHIFLDRLHHFLLPQVFVNYIWRTNQILYYPPEALFAADTRTRNICFDFRSRPAFCQDFWTNYRRSCARHDTKCKEIGLLWLDTLRRMRMIQLEYPTMQIDLTLLESQEDLQSCKGGISSTEVRRADVTAIIRARQCDPLVGCSTMYIDEYRYEVGIVASNVLQWYRVVAWLRCIGQGYYCLRLLMLLVFCYIVSPNEVTGHQRRGCTTRILKAIILFMKAPMQSVIFGSLLPIVCYAGAHAIDAAVTYEVLGNIFTTQGGVLHIKFRELCVVGFNQMRSVWLLAAAIHAVIAITTSRRKLRWTPIDGIRGVPEFLLSAMASSTVLAQFRSTSFRDSKISSIHEIHDTPTLQAVKYQHKVTQRGDRHALLEGILIDLKVFVCLLMLLWALRACASFHANLRRYHAQASQHTQTRRTPVPYSAGILWPMNSMCIHWTSDYFCVKHTSTAEATHRRTDSASSCSRVAVAARIMDTVRRFPLMLMSSSDFHSIQCRMESLHDREDDIGATVAFMNLVMMSDPVVYFCLTKKSGDKRLGYYQSERNPEKLFLLPRDIVESSNIHMQGLTLLCKVRASDVKLIDLIHCG